MPPPKAKLHKNSGKSRPGLATTSDPTASPSVSQSTLTPQQEEQFQSELYWCIQQLQGALSSNKLSNKQVQEHTKTLNTLMNNSAPIVKKRQMMRLSFGDYRSKMLEDEKKAKKMFMKISTGKPSNKSQYLKKALISSVGSDFKFNFAVSDNEDTLSNVKNRDFVVGKPENDSTKPKTLFAKSDNTFRFNFCDDNNTIS